MSWQSAINKMNHQRVSDTYTYCGGPTLQWTKDVPCDTQHMLDLLERLRTAFGPEYEWQAEPISEGGMQMTRWPGYIGGV